VIDVDALGIDAERRESVTLRGQVLLVGGDVEFSALWRWSLIASCR
jgi:hypothetical protein